MDKTTRYVTTGLRALIGMAVAIFAAHSALAQAPASANRKLPEPTITSVKATSGGDRTDRLVVEFSGREPELAVTNVDGTLVVTLAGVKLADGVARSQNADASLGVIRSVQTAPQASGVEVRVQPKVKVWTHTAIQSRRNIVIDIVAAAVQPPDEAHAALPTVPVAVVAAAPVAQGSPAEEPAADAPPKRRERVKACIECHEGFYSITKTKHYVRSDSRTPGAKGAEETAAECESCHGDLSAHQKTPRVKGLVPIVYGKKAPADKQNETCLNCHQGGTRIHWQGSAHDRAKQTCSGCHRMHAPKDPVMVTETQASVCFDCHKDRRAEMHKISTHPTKSGFIACSSCHASHGSNTRASLQKPSVNQTCYQCHAEKRGPFLWEHRSAQDDCTNCHNPHGTNVPPMLKVRQPFLCQQCHQSAGHPSTLFTGADAVPSVGNSQRILGRACTNCHNKVHGTNHPSGARLQR